MRSQLGVLLMEEVGGEVSVQLFADSLKAGEAFDNLVGRPVDPPRRATYLALGFDEKGVSISNSVSKMLPVLEPMENRPDGWVLGDGPVKFEKPVEK